MSEYNFHPAAHLLPAIPKAEFDALEEDIATNGQKIKIARWRGLILDGRHRLQACLNRGIPPLIEDIDSRENPWSYVISVNDKRRHMTASQRGLVAAELAARSREESEVQNCTSTETAEQKVQNCTLEQAADAMKVSVRTTKTGEKVRSRGSSEVVEAVRSGEIAVSKAAELVDAVPDKKKQAAIIEKGKTAVDKAIATAKEKTQPPAPQYEKGATYVYDGKQFVLVQNINPDAKVALVESLLGDELVAAKFERKKRQQADPEQEFARAVKRLPDWKLLRSLEKLKPSKSADFHRKLRKLFDAREPDHQKEFKAIWAECDHQAKSDMVDVVEKLWLQEVRQSSGDLLEFDPRDEPLPGKLNCPEFRAKWEEWCTYRDEMIGRTLTKPAAQEDLRRLVRYKLSKAILVIDTTIAEGKPELVSDKQLKLITFVAPSEEEVIAFGRKANIFENDSIAKAESRSFYLHHQSRGWVGIADWKARLCKWADEFEIRQAQFERERSRQFGGGRKEKDYSERLDACYKGDPSKLKRLTEEEKAEMRANNA